MKMFQIIIRSFLILFLFKSFSGYAQSSVKPTNLSIIRNSKLADRIVGRWMSKEKNLVVEVNKSDSTYKATVAWFDDRDDPSHPMATRTDTKNPDINLQTRRILGMQVLRYLHYSPLSHSWEDGVIYDADSGREWSACAYFTPEGTLRVKGYWKFKFISKCLDFDAIR